MAKYITIDSVQFHRTDAVYKAMAHIEDFALEMTEMSVWLRKQGRVEVAKEFTELVSAIARHQRMIMFGEREALQRIANELDLQSDSVEF